MDKSKSKPLPSPKAVPAKPKDPKADPKTGVVYNPPFTTRHGMTSPKFGSAGPGGAENEPGPEAD